jgi:hypothetical protein
LRKKQVLFDQEIEANTAVEKDGMLDYDLTPVFENLCGAKNSEVADPSIFRKNSLKFGRITFDV